MGITGMIGAGKTTLTTALGELLGADLYYEPVEDNEYLDDFYADTPRYSFAMQVYLLNRRFQQHQEIVWKARPAVQDRTIYEDTIFASILADMGLMEARDYRTYTQLFANMNNFLAKPSLLVHLDISPECSLERIRMRKRDAEAGVSLQYLQALHDGYQRFLSEISREVPVLQVDYEAFRPADELAREIAAALGQPVLKSVPRAA